MIVLYPDTHKVKACAKSGLTENKCVLDIKKNPSWSRIWAKFKLG